MSESEQSGNKPEPASGIEQAVAEALAMRPIPDEAVRAGAEAAALVAIRRETGRRAE